MNKKQLETYAKLVLKFGVNLQKGQGLELACPVEKRETAEVFAEVAFGMGASTVRIRWEDEIIDRLNLLYADENELKTVPKWFTESKLDLVKRNFCYVAIAAEDPSAFSSVPEKRIFTYSSARRKALKRFSEKVMANGIRWCVVSVPTEKWAEKVFPNQENPIKELENAILKTMRLDKAEPEKEWEKHIEKLSERAKFLNSQNFSCLHFENSAGTDLKVGLIDNHVWLSAKETAMDGVEFMANMPTEEVFTAPHRLKVNGRVYSALPLSFNGQIIENFYIDFKNGKVVGFAAEKGYETLKGLIETDKGSRRLGEVALIGKNSPIAKSGILFYNTLFDENASCHVALGKGYPTTVKGGEKLSAKELKKSGLNDSVEHVDLMIGTPDINITGYKKDGSFVALFKNGEWCV